MRTGIVILEMLAWPVNQPLTEEIGSNKPFVGIRMRLWTEVSFAGHIGEILKLTFRGREDTALESVFKASITSDRELFFSNSVEFFHALDCNFVEYEFYKRKED